MANQDAPFGFRAIGGMGSSYETQVTSKYQIYDNSTSAIFQGDLCMLGNHNSTATDANNGDWFQIMCSGSLFYVHGLHSDTGNITID